MGEDTKTRRKLKTRSTLEHAVKVIAERQA